MDLKFILQHTVGNLYWKDKEARYLGANEAFLALANLKNKEDIVGKTDRDLFSSVMSHEKLRLLEETDRRILTSGIEESLKEEGVDSNGNPAFYMTKKIPIRNHQGEITGLMGTSLDITKEMQADIARTEFLANMRHDIRTPLSGIVGFSEILKAESNEPRIKEYAENLVASSHALLSLLDEVLEAVRVSSGEIPLLKQKFDLINTFEQVVALFTAKAKEKNLSLTLSIDPQLPRFVIGDKIRLHRIALELVGNALNFTDTGTVTVNAELAKQENRQLIIKLNVADTGIGISKDKQQAIYLQFKRLIPSYEGIYKGAGLGLYVVKQFIDELEGEIYVDSEPRKGTSFTCLIPLQASLLDDSSGIDSSTKDKNNEKQYMAPLTHDLSNAAVSPDKKKDDSSLVLVVEDNLIAQAVAKALLSGLSSTVHIASNGKEAVSLCKKHDYDLIFMDIGLGEGMDGYEVTYHIRNLPNTTNKTPIIALTAHAGDDNKQRCIEAGMDAVLIKPLTKAHAEDILNAFIPKRQSVKKTTDTTKARVDLPDTDEELFQLEQFPLLDTELALQNCGNQSTLVDLLTLMVKQEIPADVERMKKAFEAEDYSLVEKTAHKIKGGAVYVGTVRMKFACQYLERYWKSGERKLFADLYHQAIKSIEDSCIHINKWLENQPP